MAHVWKQWEGQVVGGVYPLRQYLGGGEESGVFLTEFAGDEGRRAAIKLIPEDPKTAEAQLAHWKRAAQLSHPNLLRVFDSGRCRLGGEPLLYVVEEFADENLSQILPERSLTPKETREMLAPVVNALTYLHANGFVHGDLKPANIMAAGETVKVSTDRVRPIGEALSEPEPRAYDAPELATGQSTPAGDVWALGVTLVEALTQHPPEWKSASHQKPVVPETVPGPFAQVASECLRLDPQLRPTLTDVVARVYGPISPAQKLHTRGPSRLGYAPWVVGAILLLAAVYAGHEWLSRPPAAAPAATSAEPPAPKPATPPPDPSAAPEPTPASGPEIVHRAMPDVSKRALQTIHGRVRVRVRVQVDAAGNVANAKLEVPGPSHYFAAAALLAAQDWKFAPAANTERAWVLHFVFRQSGVTVEPVRVTRE